MRWTIVLAVVLIPIAQVISAFMAVTLYLHRDLSHGSIKLSKPVAMLCRIQVFYVSGMKPREWAAVHRKHHEFSDQPGDPHSPFQQGLTGKHRGRAWGTAKVLFGTAWLYHDVTHNTPVVRDYASDVPVDKWDRRVFDHGLFGPVFVLPLTQLVLLYLIFGFGWHLAWFVGMWPLAALLFLLGGGVINAIGHTAESRDFPVLDFEEHTNDFSTNLSWPICLATVGEGSHHNHHLDPGNAKFARRAIWDPGWCAISVLQWLGLAEVNRVHVR